MNRDTLTADFFQRFGNRETKPVLFFSPGRVNLIGEHTDYNAGYVLPCALEMGTYLVIRPNGSEVINMASLNFDTSLFFNTESVIKAIPGSWTNYPAGVINEFLQRDIKVPGMDMLFAGNIPNGAGLSSSASIEMATALAMDHICGTGMSTIDLVKLSQHAENAFVGMNCGIMDQFAAGFGRRNSALFLDCGTLKHEIVPFDTGNYRLIISNTNKRRGLTDSKYNERRAECEKAVELMQQYKKIDSLSDLTIEDLPHLKTYISDEIIVRRARHVITENDRVLRAVEALKKGNITEFGILMHQSHDSLKNDYEVTGHELDTLAYGARRFEGVAGSRMTGAGFGGCTVSLVDAARVKDFIHHISEAYTKKTGLTADFYTPSTGDGASMLE